MAIKAGRNPKTVKKRTGNPKGRPAGSATVLTRKKANEIVDSGESPLDIMMQNLLFYHHQSVRMAERFERLLNTQGPDAEELAKLLRKVLSLRDKAQACAVDAAPYVHPKLAAIQVKGDPDQPLLPPRMIIEFVNSDQKR